MSDATQLPLGVTPLFPLPLGGLARGAKTPHFVYASGLAYDAATGKRQEAADTIAKETLICLQRIEEVLAEAGCTKRDIAKTTCYITDDSTRREFMETYKAFFDPGPYPSRCTVKLGLTGGCRVQIEATAIAS